MARLCLIHPEHGVTHEIDQWLYLATFFGVEVYAIGAHQKRKGVTYVASVSEVPGTAVVVQPLTGRNVQGEVALASFVHPTDATYVFGGSDYIVTQDDIVGHTLSLFIPGTEELHAPLAGAIVLHARRVQLG